MEVAQDCGQRRARVLVLQTVCDLTRLSGSEQPPKKKKLVYFLFFSIFHYW
jgi:hypothetical protein